MVVHRRGSTQARESTLALKPRADITISLKQGYQWPHKKNLCPTKIFKKIMVLPYLSWKNRVHSNVPIFVT